MKAVPPIRVRHQGLSLWQSLVAQHLIGQDQSENTPKLADESIQQHPLIQGTTDFVTLAQEHGLETAYKKTAPEEQTNFAASSTDFKGLSALAFQMAEAQAQGHVLEAEALGVEVRKYSDADWLNFFKEVVKDYAGYGIKYGFVKKYNAWEQNGGLDYGKIQWQLPNDAKVAIIGDWGTGMPDAQYLLRAILNNHKPDAIIHLGDIYYAGSPTEVKTNFFDVIDSELNVYGERVPVFTIPGNHDYYSYGYAYYDMVQSLNTYGGLQGCVQEASFFQLQTQDGGWQFLGMDTGFDDSDPQNQFNPKYAGPQLRNNEFAWHKDKLDNFGGNTILLSHHQLFSGNAAINGQALVFRAYPYLNKYLLDQFRPYFGDKIAAWFWGHEHNQVRYIDGIFGLPKGRLLGASAYEEATSEDPYKSNYPEVPFLPNDLSHDQGYYNHGYGIMDFSVRSSPKDPVKVTYYEYPSWGTNPPNPIPSQGTRITEEMIGPFPKNVGTAVNFNDSLIFNLEKSTYSLASPYKGYTGSYAQANQQPVKHSIQKPGQLGDTSPIQDGDEVVVNLNGVGFLALSSTDHNVFYYPHGGGYYYNWIIKKAYPDGDPQIYRNQPVYLISKDFAGQYLCPSYIVKYTETFFTTSTEVPSQWYLE
jgi:hypothetical protein